MKSKKKGNLSRRNFIRNTSVLGAGILILPRHVLGGKGFIAPSDKLNIAAIGAGGKGSVNIRRAFNDGAENIIATMRCRRPHGRR
jgi:hypothetical protein